MTPDAPFHPAAAAKKLLREARAGALATLAAASGDPYCSLANVATAADGAPLLLLSRLALHTKNILADPRVSLMLDERRAGDPLQGARVSLSGTAAPDGDENSRRRYLARHPAAAAYAGFADFAVYRVTLAGGHLVAGFGRIVDLGAEDLLTDPAGAEALLAAEADACAHMNEDHAETVRLYATKLLGAAEGAWRCVGLDPEGLDLQCGETGLRLPFPERITEPAALRRVLRTLAAAARAAGA